MNRIGREDVTQQCMTNVEVVTDQRERQVARQQLDQQALTEPASRDASIPAAVTHDVAYHERDITKVRVHNHICIRVTNMVSATSLHLASQANTTLRCWTSSFTTSKLLLGIHIRAEDCE